MGEVFPLGAAAFHPDWPQGRFNVSGMFVYHGLILGFLKMAETGLNCRPPVDAVHGAPAVRWNGGRISDTSFDPNAFYAALEALHAQNLGCFLTFTNHLLNLDDLADPTCNLLLDAVARRPDLNGVILASDLLSKYIATKYPALRQVASIVKVSIEQGNGNPAYYQDLGRRFWRYVVHPDDCHNPRLLEQLDRSKAEIILNENCLRECTLRTHHYDLIANTQRVQAANQSLAGGPRQFNQAMATLDPQTQAAGQELDKAMAACPSFPFTRQIGARRRNCNLTRDQIKAVYDLGFRYFKLQGRRDQPFMYAYDLTRYLLEPDIAAPFAFKSLCSMIRLR